MPDRGGAADGRRRGRAVRSATAATIALGAALSDLLSSAEVEALTERVDTLLATRVFPVPGPGYPLPWPLF